MVPYQLLPDKTKIYSILNFLWFSYSSQVEYWNSTIPLCPIHPTISVSRHRILSRLTAIDWATRFRFLSGSGTFLLDTSVLTCYSRLDFLSNGNCCLFSPEKDGWSTKRITSSPTLAMQGPIAVYPLTHSSS